MSEAFWADVAETASAQHELYAAAIIKRSHLQWRWQPMAGKKLLQVLVDDEGRDPYRWLMEHLRLYLLMVDTAAKEGLQIRPYKPLEKEVILVGIESALRHSQSVQDLVETLMHELVWGQGLPNANHRTTFALLAAVLADEGLQSPCPSVYQEIAEDFAKASKPLIVDKEFAVDLETVKQRHRSVCHDFAQRILDAAQSRT